jgi:hypothetical protein
METRNQHKTLVDGTTANFMASPSSTSSSSSSQDFIHSFKSPRTFVDKSNPYFQKLFHIFEMHPANAEFAKRCWYQLCQDYLHEQETINRYHLHVAQTDPLSIRNIAKYYANPLNQHDDKLFAFLNSQMVETSLKKNSSFAKLLNAYFTCFPRQLAELNAPLRNELACAPFIFPLTKEARDGLLQQVTKQIERLTIAKFNRNQDSNDSEDENEDDEVFQIELAFANLTRLMPFLSVQEQQKIADILMRNLHHWGQAPGNDFEYSLSKLANYLTDHLYLFASTVRKNMALQIANDKYLRGNSHFADQDCYHRLKTTLVASLSGEDQLILLRAYINDLPQYQHCHYNKWQEHLSSIAWSLSPACLLQITDIFIKSIVDEQNHSRDYVQPIFKYLSAFVHLLPQKMQLEILALAIPDFINSNSYYDGAPLVISAIIPTLSDDKLIHTLNECIDQLSCSWQLTPSKQDPKSICIVNLILSLSSEKRLLVLTTLYNQLILHNEALYLNILSDAIAKLPVQDQTAFLKSTYQPMTASVTRVLLTFYPCLSNANQEIILAMYPSLKASLETLQKQAENERLNAKNEFERLRDSLINEIVEAGEIQHLDNGVKKQFRYFLNFSQKNNLLDMSNDIVRDLVLAFLFGSDFYESGYEWNDEIVNVLINQNVQLSLEAQNEFMANIKLMPAATQKLAKLAPLLTDESIKTKAIDFCLSLDTPGDRYIITTLEILLPSMPLEKKLHWLDSQMKRLGDWSGRGYRKNAVVVLGILAAQCSLPDEKKPQVINALIQKLADFDHSIILEASSRLSLYVTTLSREQKIAWLRSTLPLFSQVFQNNTHRQTIDATIEFIHSILSDYSDHIQNICIYGYMTTELARVENNKHSCNAWHAVILSLCQKRHSQFQQSHIIAEAIPNMSNDVVNIINQYASRP